VTPPSYSRAGLAATVAALLAVIAGLVVLGSPSRARARRLDDLRIADLARISGALDTYWKKHADLPAGLDTLRADNMFDRVPTDPATHAPYTYHASGERSYRLCATFAQPSDTSRHERFIEGVDLGSRPWTHGAGESCFDLTPPEPDHK
jgi:hypothetical protein